MSPGNAPQRPVTSIHTGATGLPYRSEIDGLRALAVIPVILFHAGFATFSGGYIGVDVFFVISGYLITSILLSDLERGTFSIAKFYERRARRILPALFLVMLFSCLFAWFFLLQGEMNSFAKSLVAVSTFSSNILFWMEVDYWNTTNELKPLLHTWSLAVEEQFYVLFPLFLMLMWNYKKHFILGLLIFLTVVSFAIAQWGIYHYPITTFYLLPTRGWEIAIGAIIAFFMKKNNKILFSNKLMNEILGFMGILMMSYSVFMFNEKTPFPSVYTLLPTIGACLVIAFSSSHTVIGRLLSIKPLVVTGLMSYSLYLWHQPLLAYAKHISITQPSQPTLLLVVLLAIPLAYLTWHFVEKPFRNKDIFTRKEIFMFSSIGSLLFVTIGLIGYGTNGFSIGNRATLTSEIGEKLQFSEGLSKICNDGFTLSQDCRTSDKPQILVWGDSYAMHLVPGILASNPDAEIIQMTKSSCGSFFDIAPMIVKSPAKECLEFNNQVREWLKNNTTIKYAVLSARIGNYLSKELLSRDGNLYPGGSELAAQELHKTLGELQSMGISPVIFSPVPMNDENIGKCLGKSKWIGANFDNCDFLISEISQETSDSIKFLAGIQKKYPVVFLNDLLCNNFYCKTHFNDIFVYRDNEHLSHEGSAALGEKYNFYQKIVPH